MQKSTTMGTMLPERGAKGTGPLPPPTLRRHKLPAPHLALWPTEVHVVVRRKVCEKGCYFGGIHPPPVAIGKMKVCM